MSGARRLCLVTGASAGIGAALARIYAQTGWDLVLTARRAERLEALAGELTAAYGTQCGIFPADLADPAAPRRIVGEIEAAGRPLDGLVNNAGYGGASGFLSAPWADHANFLQVMVNAPVELAHLVMPGMIERGYGRVLNVASIAGMMPPARGQSLYGAAKGFLIEASRAMTLEAEGTRVHVTALCPGLTRTEFHAVAGMEAQLSGLPRFVWQDAETVARAGYEACEADAAMRIPGWHNRIGVALFRLLPAGAGMELMAAASGKTLTAAKGESRR